MKEIFKIEKSQENIKKMIMDKRNLDYEICNIEFSNDESITVIIKFFYYKSNLMYNVKRYL